MKRFRLISSVFVALILLIFVGNVIYMVKLYESIRVSVERDVMSALADTDIDEMWERAERKRRMYMALISQAREAGDTSVVICATASPSAATFSKTASSPPRR